MKKNINKTEIKMLIEANEKMKGTKDYSKYYMETSSKVKNRWFFTGHYIPTNSNYSVKKIKDSYYLYSDNGKDRYRITKEVDDLLNLGVYKKVNEPIIEQGLYLLSIVKKYNLEKYYNPMSGFLEIKDSEFTNELKLIVINYLDELCMKFAPLYNINSENFSMTVCMYDGEKIWTIGEKMI